MIPYGRQDISEDDIAAVVAVLRSDFLTQGPAVPRFEAAVAAAAGAPHAVAVNSATSALHLACLALGLGPGDALWTTPITFVASANCARYCGAKVDFVDIDPATFNLCPNALEARLAAARRLGRLPKIVVPVHLGGEPCDLAAIHELAQRYGFSVLEDASHAIGGAYHGEPVGNGRYSEVTVFSFHPVKLVTSGEGGMLVTRRPELARAAALLRSHGITRDPAQMTRPPVGPWDYQQLELGYNFRMTDIQAALGASQMTRLADFVARRRQLAARYDQRLAGLPLAPQRRDPANASALHLYLVRLAPQLDRRAVFEALRAAGVGVNLHYIPVHTQPYYQRLGFRAGDFPEAERYAAQALSLPLYPGLTETQQDTVIAALERALEAAG